MLKLCELGEVRFRIYKLGELGEVSFGMLKLGELGEVSFGILNTTVVHISVPFMGKKCRPKTPISLSYYSSSK